MAGKNFDFLRILLGSLIVPKFESWKIQTFLLTWLRIPYPPLISDLKSRKIFSEIVPPQSY